MTDTDSRSRSPTGHSIAFSYANVIQSHDKLSQMSRLQSRCLACGLRDEQNGGKDECMHLCHLPFCHHTISYLIDYYYYFSMLVHQCINKYNHSKVFSLIAFPIERIIYK